MQFLRTIPPPPRPYAVAADEEAEAEAVAGPIPSSSTSCWPSCSVILVVGHQCRPSIPQSGVVALRVIIVRRPTITIIGTRSWQSSAVPLSYITMGEKIPIPLLRCWISYRRVHTQISLTASPTDTECKSHNKS